MHIPSPFLALPGVLMHENDDSHIAVEDTSLEGLLQEIRQKHGQSLLAILVYGSWLRGKRDTMLDFYVLVDDYQSLNSAWQALMCRLLPPNVYHIHHKSEGPGIKNPESRAKYALLTLKRFHHAISHDSHSYFWARFAQPCEVLYVRDESTQATLNDAFRAASNTFLRRVLPTMKDRFSSNDIWTCGLALTYQCELRTESSNRGDSIYDFNPGHYDKVTRQFAEQHTTLLKPDEANSYDNLTNSLSRRLSSVSWWLRRVQGKLLSLLRLTKAAFR